MARWKVNTTNSRLVLFLVRVLSTTIKERTIKFPLVQLIPPINHSSILANLQSTVWFQVSIRILLFVLVGCLPKILSELKERQVDPPVVCWADPIVRKMNIVEITPRLKSSHLWAKPRMTTCLSIPANKIQWEVLEWATFIAKIRNL